MRGRESSGRHLLRPTRGADEGLLEGPEILASLEGIGGDFAMWLSAAILA